MGTQCIDYLRLVLNQKLMKFYDLIEPSKIYKLPETRWRVDKSSKPGKPMTPTRKCKRLQ